MTHATFSFVLPLVSPSLPPLFSLFNSPLFFIFMTPPVSIEPFAGSLATISSLPPAEEEEDEEEMKAERERRERPSLLATCSEVPAPPPSSTTTLPSGSVHRPRDVQTWFELDKPKERDRRHKNQVSPFPTVPERGGKEREVGRGMERNVHVQNFSVSESSHCISLSLLCLSNPMLFPLPALLAFIVLFYLSGYSQTQGNLRRMACTHALSGEHFRC